MKGDMPAAALRLSSSCTVRTHQRSAVVPVQGSKLPNAVRIGCVTYDSLTEAGRQLRKSRGALRNMIRRGEASYV